MEFNILNQLSIENLSMSFQNSSFYGWESTHPLTKEEERREGIYVHKQPERAHGPMREISDQEILKRRYQHVLWCRSFKDWAHIH